MWTHVSYEGCREKKWMGYKRIWWNHGCSLFSRETEPSRSRVQWINIVGIRHQFLFCTSDTTSNTHKVPKVRVAGWYWNHIAKVLRTSGGSVFRYSECMRPSLASKVNIIDSRELILVHAQVDHTSCCSLFVDIPIVIQNDRQNQYMPSFKISLNRSTD